VRSNSSVINVYKKNNIRSEVDTQLLYGDTFKKIKKSGLWFKIEKDLDYYKGYIKKKIILLTKKILTKFIIYTQIYTPNQALKVK